MIGVINSFVHAVMYSYYLVAALGPKFSKFLWFKPYITWIQMVGMPHGLSSRMNYRNLLITTCYIYLDVELSYKEEMLGSNMRAITYFTALVKFIYFWVS